MTYAANNDLDALASAWRELQARTPVKLGTIENARHYRTMTNLMNSLIDEIGDLEDHTLMGLLDVVTFLLRDYDERNTELPDVQPPAVLRFLIEQHNLSESALVAIFGSRSNVSDIFNGKREINSRQAKALSRRFGVPGAIFTRISTRPRA